MASSYGIKISKEGYDVKDCEDKDLILTSKYSTLKAIQTELIDWEIEAPASGVIKTIYHNLGYRAAFLHYFEVDGTDGRWIGDIYTDVGGVTTSSNMFPDRLEILISGSPGDSGTLRYFIFADDIRDE